MLSRFFRWVACLALLLMSSVPVIAYAQTAAPVTSQTTADSNTVELAIPIGAVKSVSGLPQYVSVIYRYSLGIVTLVAIIMVIYGGFQYLLGASMGQIGKGKSTIQDALSGMAILFLAYVILYTVNPKLTTLSLPSIQRIQTVGVAGDAAVGNACTKDSDCGGGSCMRMSAAGGVCSNGRAGSLCQCEGTGCNVSDADAGGPTHGQDHRTIPCQEGLQCQAVSEGHFVCNGAGTGQVCNETSHEQVQGPSAVQTGARAGGLMAATVIGAPAAPFVALATGAAVAAGNSVVGAVSGPDRAAIRCQLPGQFCFQPRETLAGACVYGDHRDTDMFVSIFTQHPNAELQETIQHCEYTEAQIRSTAFAYGGCGGATGAGPVDEFCVAHRYHCGPGAACAQTVNGSLFAGTLRAYGSLSNTPQQLRPETFMKLGCFKDIGQSCTSNAECASVCINNRCSGFGALEVKDSVAAGSLRGAPTRDQVQYVTTATGCEAGTWTGIDLWQPADTEAHQDRALSIITGAGGIERYACYPGRPAGAKCDFNGQCTSHICSVNVLEGAVSVPSTFSHPLDNNVGAGTCT